MATISGCSIWLRAPTSATNLPAPITATYDTLAACRRSTRIHYLCGEGDEVLQRQFHNMWVTPTGC